jgi:octaprenyl-diphosphate synthase
LGAHYADADETIAKSLEQYGRSLGMAFQISDDLLDILGSEDQTGKSLGTDFKKQKLTLPLIRLLAQTEEPEALRLRELLTQADDDAWGEVVRWLHRSDAVEYSRNRALEFAALARSHLDCLSNSSAKQMLVEITEFATQRSY